jgi:hypothetical protein
MAAPVLEIMDTGKPVLKYCEVPIFVSIIIKTVRVFNLM